MGGSCWAWSKEVEGSWTSGGGGAAAWCSPWRRLQLQGQVEDTVVMVAVVLASAIKPQEWHQYLSACQAGGIPSTVCQISSGGR